MDEGTPAAPVAPPPPLPYGFGLPAVAPYHPPPPHPPPGYHVPTDGRATASMALAILGMVFGLPFGLPGMVLGPIAYFLGRAARDRIDASGGAIGGRSQAHAGSILGAVAMAIGCLVSLGWLVLFLNIISVTS